MTAGGLEPSLAPARQGTGGTRAGLAVHARRTVGRPVMSADRNAFLDAALSYTEQSPQWPIFPVHPVTKRPLIKTGVDHAANASTDPEQIERWLRRWPGCGIGMPTGAASGTVVIDVDRKHDGEVLLAELEDALCPLPRVRTVRTQHDGLHVYLAHPAAADRVRSFAGQRGPLGKLLCGRPGVDVRADGGIVVLPPSLGYRWLRDEDEPLPPLPRLWLAAIQGAGSPPSSPWLTPGPESPNDHRWSPPERGARIAEGGRSDELYRRGAMLHLTGATDPELVDDLLRMNAARCAPPLAEREVMKIASSAARATGRRA